MENLGMSEGLRFTIFTENLGMRHVSTSHSMPPQGGKKPNISEDFCNNPKQARN
jgi:hypothetical protein